MNDAGALEWRRLAALPLAEAYELLRFRQAIFVVEQGSPYPDLDGRDMDAWHLRMRGETGLAGYLRLLAAPGLVRIGRVCVAPPRRGHGLGRRLVAEALTFAQRNYPQDDIRLSAQTALAAFYREYGFVEIAAPYDDFGVPHVDMVRRPG
jgi:ElaA protein